MTALRRLIPSILLLISSVGCAEELDTDPGRQLREFVVYNYRRLTLDVIDGGGSYLATLEYLIHDHCSPEKVAELFWAVPDQVQFAIRLSEQCRPDSPVEQKPHS